MIRTYFENDGLTSLAQKTAKAALISFGISDSDADMEIASMTKDEIQVLNAEMRGVDSVTDVLSFCNLDIKFPFSKKDYPYDINPESGGVMLGEIYICLERAAEQALEYGHSEEREFAFLVCHGVLHLLGLDHIEKADEEVMTKKQEEILTSLNILR